MYEDKRRRIQINWKSLLIKLAILLVVVFLVIWIISLVNRDREVESNFSTNFDAMRSAATEYFTGSRLPQELNESVSISLQDMFDEDLLVEFFDEYGNPCDTSNSYAEATKISDTEYRIEIRLVCDNESDTVINTVEYKSSDIDQDPSDTGEDLDDDIKIPEEPETDPDADDNDNTDNNTNNNTNNSTNNNTNNNNNSSNNNDISSNNNDISSNNNNQSSSSTVAVTQVVLNYKRIVVEVGSTRSVEAYIYPSNATNKSVSWSSSNTSVATVNGGAITGHKAGSATVTAVVGGKSTTVEVVVVDNNSNTNVNTCSYGTNEYYTNLYTLAYRVEGNCAVSYSSIHGSHSNNASNIGVREYQKLVQEMLELEEKLDVDLEVQTPEFVEIKNTSGTGYVGYQIYFSVKSKTTPYSSQTVYSYFLNQNLERVVLVNELY